MQSVKRHRRAVILGAGGFIGINLAHALALEDSEVICFDRVQCPHWPQKVKSITGEFADMPPELLAVLDDATVYHLVSSCRPSQQTDTAADEVVNDVATTLRYLERTRALNIRWVFVSSGGTVYGPNVPCPTHEDASTNPICSYGLVKLALEKYFALYKKLHGTDFVIARISNPYGPWQDPLRGQGVIAALIYKALAGQAVEIWGDGENVRDYLYIDDAVRGLMELAGSGESGEIYNLSSGKGSTINELINVISRTLDLRVNTNYTDARISDVRKSILDNNKLRQLTGWNLKVGLDDGIKVTAKWLSAQGIRQNDKLLQKTIFSHRGYCPICENNVTFSAKEPWFRDHFFCSSCGSIPRERALMKVISDFYPNWRDLAIHESSPGGRGASIKLHSECNDYTASQYYPNIIPGQAHPKSGYRCENIEKLTFADNSFDLFITQDVMEHIFDPEKSFQEIARVLRPGGAHIFTVPLINKVHKSERWASRSEDNTIIYHHPAEYHGNPVDEKGALVTMHWGYDIASFITETAKTPTTIVMIDNIDLGIQAEYIDVLVSVKC